jgi:hypothetical protein
MSVDVRSHLDFLDFDRFLLLAGFGGFFLILILQLAEIHDLAHRWFSVWHDLNEIETRFFCHRNGVLRRDTAVVMAFGINKLDPGNPDITVGARSVFLDRRRSERSANGRYLLIINVIGGLISLPATAFPHQTPV